MRPNYKIIVTESKLWHHEFAASIRVDVDSFVEEVKVGIYLSNSEPTWWIAVDCQWYAAKRFADGKCKHIKPIGPFDKLQDAIVHAKLIGDPKE